MLLDAEAAVESDAGLAVLEQKRCFGGSCRHCEWLICGDSIGDRAGTLSLGSTRTLVGVIAERRRTFGGLGCSKGFLW